MEDQHIKWDRSKGKRGKHKDEVPSAKEEVNPEYEEYLMLLQERNRLLRKLKEKDDQQIKLEKKEQGFSIYVNGANVELGRAQTRAKSRSSLRHSKTAGDTYHERKRILQHELQYLEGEAGTREARVKTAPDEGTTARKGWKYDSIQIKTDEGKKLRIRAPGKLTGMYSEDFESFALDGSDNEDETQNLDIVGDDPDNSSEHEEQNFDNDEDDDEETDELALSFNDVETLRKSLEADETIRESIESAQKRLQQERKEGEATEDDDDVSDDEIAEELEEANDSLNLHDAAVLGQLPQLSSAVDQRQHDFKSVGAHNHDRTSATEGSMVNSENNPPSLTAHSQDSTASREDHIHGKQLISKKYKGASKPTVDRVSVRKHTEDKTYYQRSKGEEALLSSKDQQLLEENPGEDLVVLSFSSFVKKRERVLSARWRKENTDNCESSQPMSSKTKKDANIQEPKRLPSDELQEQKMTLTSAHKKRIRPLSATRKSTAEDKLDSNAEEIFRAMAEENQTIESRIAGCQTAPERSKNNSSPLPERNRPSSISSLPMKTEDTIALLTEKVRHMDARQQWYLIDLLAKLECKTPFKSSGPIQSPRQSPLKATVPFIPVTNSASAAGSSQQCDITDSLNVDERYETQSNEEGTDVYFEILSNWGNPKLLGLTEIQFFDLEGNRISYNGQDVIVSGHVGLDGPLENLANGKTKTTKGRYMWCCEYQVRCPVELVFHLPYTTTTEYDSHGLSKICVWNFNRGIKELNVGVKDVRIFVGGELVWEGIIDKGCGNQVFDYCKAINLLQKDTEDLTEIPEPVIRSETVLLRRSRDLDKEGDLRRSRSEMQEKEVQPSTRGKTRLLKRSTEGDVPKIGEVNSKNGAGVAMDSQLSVTVESTQPKENVQKLPRPPGSSRSHSRSPRTARRSKTELEKSVERGDQEVRRTSTPKRDSLPLAEKTLQSLLDTSKSQLESALSTRSNSTPNLPTSTAAAEKQDSGNDSIRGNAAAVSALPSKPPWLESSKKKDKDGSSSRSSSRSKSRPIWLKNDSGISEGRSSSLTDVRDSTDSLTNEKPQSRPPSGRNSSTPSGTQAEPWPSAFLNKDESLPTFLDNTAAQVVPGGRSGSGRRREEAQEPKPPNCEDEESRQHHDPQSARAKWRRQQNLSLEESWSLLTLFEKSHRGRITKDVDLENHDDALDQLLSNRKEENQERTKEAAKETEERLIDLEIPTLPKGKQLIINVRSTWGDRHYVGLNGIEVFTDTGKPADIAEITANPLDINILPEYGNDPRVVTNLIDGVYRTRDDMHLWLAPFTPGGLHSITITFLESVRVAMIRIWNYNKSRIHSFRGVRCIDMSLDGCLIFQGEIERASGTLGADDPFGDTILFTMDEDILESMAQYDQTYDVDDEEEDSLMQSCNFERPSTANQGEDGGNEDRPFTSARQHIKKSKPAVIEDELTTSCDNCLVGKMLQLNFVSTWGDPYYLGLTGLEVLGVDIQPIPLSFNMLTACPRDLNDLPEYEDDDRTLDKLIDGSNITLSDEHMWLIPFTEGEDHVLIIDLGQSTPIAGLRIWNYNKSTDDSFRGAKEFHLKLDDRIISPPEGFLLRKGPGNVHFDYGQDVYFVKPVKEQPTDCKTEKDAANPRLESHVNLKKLMPDYEPTLMPCGFVFQFQLFSTWGDPYYIGLNGLEFYDENGYKIKLSKNNITAHPHSVNVLEGVVEDIRTPDKLIDGFNDTNDGRHMWLAPVIPGMINFIYVVFDEPLKVSMVKVWNYSKTPIRGVQQFGLLVDDLLVYNGILPQVPAVTRGILPNLDMPTPHHTILFTDQEQIALSERKNVLSNRGGEQDIQLTNDKRIVSHFNDPKSAGRTADPALRPMTSVPAATQRKR